MAPPVPIEQIIELVNKAGAAGGAIFVLMWLLERKERQRLQKILETFLPTFESASRVMRSVKRVITGNDDDNG